MAHKRSPGQPRRSDGAHSPRSSHRNFFLYELVGAPLQCGVRTPSTSATSPSDCGACSPSRSSLDAKFPVSRPNMSVSSFPPVVPVSSIVIIMVRLPSAFPDSSVSSFLKAFNCHLPVSAFCHSLSLCVLLVWPPWPAHESMPHAS